MKTSRTAISLLLIAGIAIPGSAFAQKKQKPPAKAAPNAKPGAKPVKAPAAGVKGREEAEISAPKPTAAKLPEAKYENEDMSKNPTRGTFTFTMTGGLYNFNNKTANAQTNTSREYSLPFDYTTMVGYELAFRLGKDKENDDDSKSGFHYYRSNRGIFTDFELGMKTQRYEDKPSRFTYKETSAAGTSEVPVDLGYDYTSALFLANSTSAAQNLRKAGISPQLKQAAGNKSVEVTMVYANTYYHFTPLNFIMNWGSSFRWFDASIGPSFRVWYYQDYSDPVRLTTRNDDWTRATFMVVYRQYVQFHPQVRLRTHFYFPALSYFAELAKSPRFNENEFILNTALEFYVKRFGDFGVIVGVGYEGHWWKANPYNSDRFTRTGFLGDNGFTDQNFAGFEHSTRTSWEAFASLAVEIHFGDKP